MSKRSRCGAVRICLERGEPSAEIVRVEALSLWRRANLSWSRRTLCGDPACRSALAVAPCEFVLTLANPLRRSCASKRSRCGAVCVSDRSRCGAVRICLEPDEPSAECVSKRSRCGAVRFSCSRNGLWKLSRGLRACFRNPAVSGSIPPWSAAAPA